MKRNLNEQKTGGTTKRLQLKQHGELKNRFFGLYILFLIDGEDASFRFLMLEFDVSVRK